MDHVAIMKKSWGLIPKILSGEKKIESRWYKARFSPWDRIGPDDTVYFKNSGEPIMAKAKVERVIQFADLDLKKAGEIVSKYGDRICLRDRNYRDWFNNQHYCLLIFLKNPQPIEPFNIDKTGFGSAAAWLVVKDISVIMRSVS